MYYFHTTTFGDTNTIHIVVVILCLCDEYVSVFTHFPVSSICVKNDTRHQIFKFFCDSILEGALRRIVCDRSDLFQTGLHYSKIVYYQRWHTIENEESRKPHLIKRPRSFSFLTPLSLPFTQLVHCDYPSTPLYRNLDVSGIDLRPGTTTE